MKKILILSNNDVGLYKFRKEIILRLVEEYEVFVSLPHGDYTRDLKDLGCVLINTPIDRRGTNPLKDLKLFKDYRKIIREVKPDVVLTYTVKPNIYGGLACRLNNTPYLANITGLGTAIENGGWMQKAILKLYKSGLKQASCVFFQNGSNKRFFEKNKIIDKRARLIPGSGVNLVEHKFENFPLESEGIRFLFIGRIMSAKGIKELFEAAKRVKKKYPDIVFDLVGSSEEDYNQQIKELEAEKIVNYHGHQNDIHSLIKGSHATILPSHHEGLANVLLESASSGRPVLASRIPGCIETFDDGISGLSFEVRNVDDLSEKIIKFIEIPYDEKRKMGIEGRKKIEREFDRKIVVDAYIDEIHKVEVKHSLN